MPTTLHPRYIAPLVKEALRDTPVVCLLGPRQSGKTTLAKGLEPDRAYITFDDGSLLNIARQDPTGFLRSLPPQVTLDEVQRIPELLPAVKALVDEARKPGRFILTGSANLLLLAGVQESLAGRVEVFYLNPLSEQEKHHSAYSLLQGLLEDSIKPDIRSNQKPVPGIAEAIMEGGYPEPNTRTGARAHQWYKQYVGRGSEESCQHPIIRRSRPGKTGRSNRQKLVRGHAVIWWQQLHDLEYRIEGNCCSCQQAMGAW